MNKVVDGKIVENGPIDTEKSLFDAKKTTIDKGKEKEVFKTLNSFLGLYHPSYND